MATGCGNGVWNPTVRCRPLRIGQTRGHEEWKETLQTVETRLLRPRDTTPGLPTLPSRVPYVTGERTHGVMTGVEF